LGEIAFIQAREKRNSRPGFGLGKFEKKKEKIYTIRATEEKTQTTKGCLITQKSGKNLYPTSDLILASLLLPLIPLLG